MLTWICAARNADAAQDSSGRTFSTQRSSCRHRFELSKIMKAYDTFGNASKERALEVVLKNAKRKRRSLKENP